MLKKIFIFMLCAAFVGSVNAQTDKGGSDKGSSTTGGDDYYDKENSSSGTDKGGSSAVDAKGGNDNIIVTPNNTSGTSGVTNTSGKTTEGVGSKDPSGITGPIAEMELSDLQNIQIPDKWKNESAIILSRSTHYKYRISTRSTGYYYYTREVLVFSKKTKERILLADQSVVDEYSEFLYSDDESVDVRVVKKDGTIVSTAQRHVVKKEIQIPVEDGYGRKRFVSAVYNKMAVPNLQVGDIIEVIEKSEAEFNWSTFVSIDFPTQYVPLQSKFPIMEQEFEIVADDGLTVLSVSKNGAPELEEDGGDTYNLKAKSTERYEGEMFNSYYRNSPYVKFAVYQCLGGAANRFFGGCRGTDGDLRPSASEVRKAAWYRINAYKPLYIADEIRDYVRKHGREASTEERAKMAYYYLKHITLLNPSSIKKKPREKDLEPIDLSNEEFILTLARAYEYLDIPFQMVVLTSREFSTLADMVMESEMRMMLVTGTEDDPTFFYHFAELSDLEQLPTSFEGQEAYIFPFNSAVFDESGSNKTVKIPHSKHTDNVRFVGQNIALNLNDLEITSERSTTSQGHFKIGTAKRFLSKQDVMRADSELQNTDYNGNSLRPASKHQLKLANWQRKNRWAYEEWVEVRDDYGAAGIENGFNVYDYSLDVQNMGWNNDSAFQYVETYTADGLLKRAGDNYILDAGKLIDSQIEVKEDAHVRENGTDIFVDFAKTYDNEIRIEIPAGYKVDNINALNYSVDNETGSFESAARMEGNTLVITAKKIYKKQNLPASKWSEMTKFLDAAYDFTKQKILIKKL